jgi:HK97 gp10 family phage protein
MAKHFSDREYQRMMNAPDVQRVLQQRAEAIQTDARRRIKHVTGKTADSVAIVTATRDDGVKVRRIGYDLDVSESGPYYEFGTEDTSPHPTLRAAGKSVRGKR